MQTSFFLQGWLDHLRLLTPVTGVVHVGAGTGREAERYADWGVHSAVLIEADESCHDKLATVAFGRLGWSTHTALLSDREEEKDFYLASNPNENSVLAPESLASLWRNLKAKEQRRINATTLDSLLTELHHQPETTNWVVIDCLPALPVMRGAGLRLNDWDVIIARVVLEEAQLQAAGAAKDEIDAFLSKHGYRCIACEEERQPAIGMALYIRDWKASFFEHQQQVEQLAKAAARDQQELERQREALKLTETALEALKAKEAQWSKEKTELVASRDSAQHALVASQRREQQLLSEQAETNLLQQKLKEEMAKTEIQLELVKELFQREPNL